MKDLTLVVFDVDGTLVDSAALIVEGFAAAFAAIGKPTPPRETVLAQVGLSLPEAVRGLMPEADTVTLDRAVEGYRSHYLKIRAERGPASVPLFKGAREEIERLAAMPDVLVGAATGMARRGLDHVLEVHDLGRHFVTRQTADGHPSKPHPSMLETALAETGVAPRRAVMIGDTSYDMDMAVNAGIAGIGVSWGHHDRTTLHAAGARTVVDDFTALAGAIDSFREAPA